MSRILGLAAAILLFAAGGRAAVLTPLFARGYTVIPSPQHVELETADVRFGPGWKLELVRGVAAGDVAVASLREDLGARFHLRESSGGTVVRLAIAPGAVTVGETAGRDHDSLASQAYRLEIATGSVRINANAAPGLFYGVQTLVQLLKPLNGELWLPGGVITDWPDLGLRQMYWDDAHHLERPSELKRAIRQAAFFKINGFAIKLEGHFQYRSAPALVEPHALSPAEFQDLTDYALRYHVQLIPYLDAPAHIAFILKHPEYASLRAFPDSNYELCTVNPESYRLLTGMFQDLLDANKGGRYFYLSTDEPYYIGMADNPQCREKAEAQKLGSAGKLLAQFLVKAAGYLHDRGRTVIFWGEFPLKVDDIPALPPYLVNGELYGPEFDKAFHARGIRSMIYTSTEGEEKLFPDYFLLPSAGRVHPARPGEERVAGMLETISSHPSRKVAGLSGTVVAGWADMGLHPETFWLGYATGTAAGWHPGGPDARESMSTFYPLFYGHSVVNLDRLYQLMSRQAQFWADSWDTIDSTARKPIWGNSNSIFNPRRPAHDQTFPLPPAPGTALDYGSDWRAQNQSRLRLAGRFRTENDELAGLLDMNLQRAQFNRYTLEVFRSIAALCRQNLDMITALDQVDLLFVAAQENARREQPRPAVAALDSALGLAEKIRVERNRVLADATATWYRSWYPREREANGRRFLHELDDVKDHLPDRTVDMSYLIYRELLLPADDWVAKIRSARNAYAQAHHLPLRNDAFDWQELALTH